MSIPLWDTGRHIVMDREASCVDGVYRQGVVSLYVKCPHCSSLYGPYDALSAAQSNRTAHLRDCDCRESENEETAKLFVQLRGGR